MRSVTAALVAVAATLVTATAGPSAAAAAPPPAAAGDLREEQLSIPTSDGLSLPATLRVPTDARPGLPGVVLVHGAGPGPREEYRAEAEAFARAGIVTLAYDKRTVGYSLTERSYPRLAEDAAAAAALLRERPEVDRDAVGLWGLSEGGWVAPLAAAKAPQTAFLVVVGANGLPPLRQQVWADALKMQLAGVRGSLVDAASRTSYRLINGMGMFPEPYYDPGPTVRRLTLPVLGIWGAQDRLTPPVESAAAFQAALDEAGNRHYTLRTFAGAEHSLWTTTDGFDKGSGFAPGYVDLVDSWVGDVVADRPPPSTVAGTGEQPRTTVEVPPLAWYESVWLHAGALVVMLVGFAGFGVGAAWRRLRGRPGPPSPLAARVLAAAGPTAVLGALTYLGFLMATRGRSVDPGPMLGGPAPGLAGAAADGRHRGGRRDHHRGAAPPDEQLERGGHLRQPLAARPAARGWRGPRAVGALLGPAPALRAPHDRRESYASVIHRTLTQPSRQSCCSGARQLVSAGRARRRSGTS